MSGNVHIIPVATLAILITSFPIHADHAGMHDEHEVPAAAAIGDVDFGAACDASVQKDFDHALGLMHHMMYVQARAEFEDIISADPDCAMAYWGVATTLFQPLWGTRPSTRDLNRGWDNIRKAGDLTDSERERYLIDATAGFFQDPESTDFWPRIVRWVDGMQTAYAAYPDDHDIAALYALSRLTLAQRADDRAPLHDEAESILREIFNESPAHPGAIHYSIHATDADGRAENALDMVEAYADIAPEVPHALHMPSHIYVRLGDWPQVIEWNARSAEAALNHPVNGAVSHHYIHAIDYLIYAYLQRGEDEKAVGVFEEAMNKDPYQGSFISAFHVAIMPARLAVERSQWEEAVALQPRTPDYLPWDASAWAEGLTWYARGLGGVHTGDMNLAQQAEQRLQALRDGARADGDDHFATYIEIDRRILAGRIAHAEGNPDQAVALIRSAAELERTIEKHPVTPGTLLPPKEALGNLLMEMGDPAAALQAYQASEEIWPGRYNTLLGMARAAAATGDHQAASEYYTRLLDMTGDSRRPGLAEAGDFLGL